MCNTGSVAGSDRQLRLRDQFQRYAVKKRAVLGHPSICKMIAELLFSEKRPMYARKNVPDLTYTESTLGVRVRIRQRVWERLFCST